jgi:hypothetical protein
MTGRGGRSAIPIGLVAGLVVGLLGIASVRHWSVADSDADTGAGNPAAQLLSAWSRYRHTTWRIVGEFVRTSPSGAVLLRSPVVQLQRPPQRVSVRNGVVERRIDSDVLLCVDEASGCTTGTSQTDYEGSVQAELDGLRRLVSGVLPDYLVERSGDCFTLVVQRDHQALDRYGQRTTLCFDGTTGALSASTVERATATDTFKATTVIGTVSDDDLRLVGSTG